MELPTLVLENAEKTGKVVDILSDLIVGSDRAERVKEVFREEVELGLKFGLEKVPGTEQSKLLITIYFSLVFKWKQPM